MPQLISLKFSEKEMPKRYSVGSVADVKLEDFVVAPRDSSEDIGFVSAIEYVSREQLKLRPDPYAAIIRKASENEVDAFFLRKAAEEKALVLCKEKALEHNLPMKVSMARIDPRSGKHIFHFTSDKRVDFRALVKELSSILRSRIELWQIGVRDEAKAMDGFGVCGLQTCCSSWLPDFRPINIKMAKDQDINLPPSKLSGQCGRLLCCLSYEVDQYREMSDALLPKGATIKLDERDGIIVDRNIINQTYVIYFKDGGTKAVKLEDLQEVRVPDQMKKMADVFRSVEKKPEKQPEFAEAPVTSFEDDKKEERRAKQDQKKTERPQKAKHENKQEQSDNQEDGKKNKRRGRGKRGRGRGRGNKDQNQQQASENKQNSQQHKQQAKGDGDNQGEGGGKKRRRGRRGRGRGKGKGQGQQPDSNGS